MSDYMFQSFNLNLEFFSFLNIALNTIILSRDAIDDVQILFSGDDV